MNERFCTHCQNFKKSVQNGKMVRRGNQLKWVCQSCLERMKNNRKK